MGSRSSGIDIIRQDEKQSRQENRVSAWTNLVVAAATIAMFVIGLLSYKLAKRVQDQSEQQQKDFSDLLEAIVISNLLAGSEDTGFASRVGPSGVDKFKKMYKGQKIIFRE